MRTAIVLFGITLLAGCSFLPKYQTPFDARNPQLDAPVKPREGQAKTHLHDTADRFSKAYDDVKDNPQEASLIKTYMDTGITYSHLLCEDYFARLTFTKAQRDYVKNESNLVGGLASSLMGLAKASSGSVAATGALFSFGEASLETYNESFLVSPDLANLKQLVLQKQAEEEAIIYRKLNHAGTWPNRIETFDQAERALSGYINHCTVNGIRTLLEQSVADRTEAVRKNAQAIPDSPKTPASIETK